MMSVGVRLASCSHVALLMTSVPQNFCAFRSATLCGSLPVAFPTYNTPYFLEQAPWQSTTHRAYRFHLAQRAGLRPASEFLYRGPCRASVYPLQGSDICHSSTNIAVDHATAGCALVVNEHHASLHTPFGCVPLGISLSTGYPSMAALTSSRLARFTSSQSRLCYNDAATS